MEKVSGDNSPSAFKYVYHQGDPGNGIGGYFLADPADRIIAYDYGGTGRLDHLVCYRPGTVTGIVWILGKVSNLDRADAFAPVYQGGGIGGYDLTVPIDQIMAYDLEGTGKLDGLICYRPGWGTIWFIRHKAAGPATLTRCKMGQANLSGVNLARSARGQTSTTGQGISYLGLIRQVKAMACVPVRYRGQVPPRGAGSLRRWLVTSGQRQVR